MGRRLALAASLSLILRSEDTEPEPWALNFSKGTLRVKSK